MILVGLVIICSRECVKQNSKYDLVRWGISLLTVFAGLCLKISLSLGCKFILISPRRWHSWDSKTLVSLNVRSRQFIKSYLPGGLCKIPIRTGLNLGRKTSIKILSVFMQKLGFRLYEIEFLTKQATLPPLRNRSDLTRSSYPYISSSLLKTVLSSLVSLNPITVAFVSLAM